MITRQWVIVNLCKILHIFALTIIQVKSGFGAQPSVRDGDGEIKLFDYCMLPLVGHDLSKHSGQTI